MRRVTRDSVYNGYSLLQSMKQNSGHYVEILYKIRLLFDYMLNHHNKVYFVTLVAKFPYGDYYRYGDNNNRISEFIENLTLYYKRKKYDPKYLWARESSVTGHHHYHIMLLFNGNCIQNAYGILDKSNKLWARCLGIDDATGLIHLCNPNDERFQSVYPSQYGGIMMRRDDPNMSQAKNECFIRASYLGKCYSKGNAPMYINEFGCSRIPSQVYA